jgi:hypothetical protein
MNVMLFDLDAVRSMALRRTAEKVLAYSLYGCANKAV